LPDPEATLAAEYSSRAAAYADRWAPVIRPMALPLLAALPLKQARSVLDIGAGTGSLLGDLRQRAPSASVIGVDRAEGMLRLCRSDIGPLAVCDAQALCIATSAVDVALLVFALFHMPDPVKALAEAARVLRPAGMLGITTWGCDPGLPGLQVWTEELDRAGAAPDPRDPRVMQQAVMDSPGKLAELIRTAGVAVVNTWSETLELRWTPDGLARVQASCGMASRRLSSLSAPARQACEARARDRLGELDAAALVYRPEVVFATATPRTARRG
jgi:SAM-dependent methyltransferase